MNDAMKWTVEVLAADGRSRKYHEPLYVTPEGLLAAFPESPEHLFESSAAAQEAARETGHAGRVAIKTLSLMTLFRSARYKRWAAEVKERPDGQPFKEQRMRLEDSWALYQSGGRQALRDRFSASHTSQLVSRFRKVGWLTEEESPPE